MSGSYLGNQPNSGITVLGQMPIGSIVQWGTATPPAGWIECNGQSTSQFAELAALFGGTVPDMRGQFARGFDNGAGVDAGRALLSSQDDELKSHEHQLSFQITDRVEYNPANGLNPVDSSNNAFNGYVKATGGVETRPKNIALMFIVKAYHSDMPVASGILAPQKNYIVNPTFIINQREFGGGNTNNTYGFDRWRGTVGGGDSISVTLPDANGFVTISGAVDSGSGFQQRVEKFGYAGTMTLSWEGTALAKYYDANGGSYSTPQASPIVVNVTETGNVTEALDLFTWENGTLKNVKLETGSVVTPFEIPDVGTELAKCERYFQAFLSPPMVGNIGGGTNSTDIQRLGLTFKPMRVAPTAEIIGTPKVYDGALVGNLSGVFTQTSLLNSIELNGTSDAVMTYTVRAFIDGAWTLNLSAEL